MTSWPVLGSSVAPAPLCAGYVADAIGGEVKPWQSLNAGAALSRVDHGQAEPVLAVGLLEEHPLAAPELAGPVPVAEGRVAHLMAFTGIAAAHDVNQ